MKAWPVPMGPRSGAVTSLWDLSGVVVVEGCCSSRELIGSGVCGREAQSGRRLLGTNGGSLWLWCCLPQPGALGP